MKIQILLITVSLLISIVRTKLASLSELSSSKDFNLFKSNISKACDKGLFEGLIGPRYMVNEVEIQTADGYILSAFRMQLYPQWMLLLPDNLKNNINRPVLQQHGICDSSDSWFLNKEDGSIGFYLLEQGFDLWIGNSRGNKYSKKHVNETISDFDFFNYSFDEMALYDLPAVYKKIMSEYQDRPDTKIIYIGHSQGTSQMFAGLTNPLRDDVRKLLKEKTEILFAIEPIIYMTEINNTVLRQGVSISDSIITFAKDLGISELNTAKCTANDSWLKLLSYACETFGFLCEGYDVINGFDPKVDNINEVLETFQEHNPSGTSLRSFEHYAQLVKGKDFDWLQNRIPTFRMYDYSKVYGYGKNRSVYGQDTPPDYNLKDFETNLVLVVGTEDSLASSKNVDNLVKELPTDKSNFIEQHKIEGWNHNTLQVPKQPRQLFDLFDKYFEDQQ